MEEEQTNVARKSNPGVMFAPEYQKSRSRETSMAVNSVSERAAAEEQERLNPQHVVFWEHRTAYFQTRRMPRYVQVKGIPKYFRPTRVSSPGQRAAFQSSHGVND
jgi:hypothetical protein